MEKPGSKGLELTMGERWYAVYTQPHKEVGAQFQLVNQNFRSFLPQLRKIRRHARKTDTVLAPFFPRYLFVILDLKRDQWRSVNGTFGVSSLVMRNDRPQVLPVGIVEQLMASSDAAGVLHFDVDGQLRQGQKIELVSGPFANQTGIVERLDGNERVRILLDMMDNKIPVAVSSRDLIPAD